MKIQNILKIMMFSTLQIFNQPRRQIQSDVSSNTINNNNPPYQSVDDGHADIKRIKCILNMIISARYKLRNTHKTLIWPTSC